MGYLLHFTTLLISYLLKGILGTIVYVVFLPIGLIVAGLKFLVMATADFLQYLLDLTETIVVAKPVAFTFNGAVKEWRSRLEEYRENPNHRAKQIARKYLKESKEGSPVHKGARAYLFAFDKAQEDLAAELEDPCDFDFDVGGEG